MQELLQKHNATAELKTPNGEVYKFSGIVNHQNIVIKSTKRKVRGKIISIYGKDSIVNIKEGGKKLNIMSFINF